MKYIGIEQWMSIEEPDVFTVESAHQSQYELGA
jgi:hypothetical protein